MYTCIHTVPVYAHNNKQDAMFLMWYLLRCHGVLFYLGRPLAHGLLFYIAAQAKAFFKPMGYYST